jgi:hypothetical protein
MSQVSATWGGGGEAFVFTDRQISGGVEGSRLASADSGNKRKHFPGDVRPARPARWLSEAIEHGVIDKTS